MKKYFSGEVLYGDDFTDDEIREWFRDEEEGYSDLINVTKDSYIYEYHGINIAHGFNILPKSKVFESALGVGAAYGEEFNPILNRLKSITILDPSETFKDTKIKEVPLNYVQPAFNGKLEFKDASFDLITCFGTLHHIPNVSDVVKELSRILKPEGYFIVREPIYSMGDWRKPRPGLTSRERGIPHTLLDAIFKSNGLETVSKKLCLFSGSYYLGKIINNPFNNRFVVALDRFFSTLFSTNIKYHRTQKLHKLAPTSVFYVLKK